ncbi:DUF5926 family protein [Haloechinothrix sp. LS1_15]|uniref:DUF5926 family protein n=1 Tax=Haloechinothrix sp. LS1_15 TaxID=2652248 RepID=UPI002945D575|nr:DUF5926 family protein [Haloechinothrix sp. LS1_15]MDV6014535.1 hypothetical protein [Haloechinothrix sp. LS1_15]
MGKAARKARSAKQDGATKRRKQRDVFVGQPFEGLAAETELIALREFVPSATAPLPLAAGHDREVQLATVLPGAAAATVRSDGTAFLGLQVQAKSSDVSRDLGRALRWLLHADPGDVLAVADTASEPVDGERLQDLLDAERPLVPQLHQDFSWWLAPEERDSAATDPAVEQANKAIMPTERLFEPGDGAQPGAPYWVDAGERAHLRWVRPEPEARVLAGMARLSARGQLTLGEGSRYAGSFRAHGLLVPVWDLDREAHAREWAEPAARLGERLEEAIAGIAEHPLDSEERRLRDGLIGRQFTIR